MKITLRYAYFDCDNVSCFDLVCKICVVFKVPSKFRLVILLDQYVWITILTKKVFKNEACGAYRV